MTDQEKELVGLIESIEDPTAKKFIQDAWVDNGFEASLKAYNDYMAFIAEPSEEEVEEIEEEAEQEVRDNSPMQAFRDMAVGGNQTGKYIG